MQPYFTIHAGDLYDTRRPNWSHCPPVRPRYQYHCRDIRSIRELASTLRSGEYTSLGGYPMYFITADGEPMSFSAVRDNYRAIIEAIKTPGSDPQWGIISCHVNYEDTTLVCADTGEPIPSAYGDDYIS